MLSTKRTLSLVVLLVALLVIAACSPAATPGAAPAETGGDITAAPIAETTTEETTSTGDVNWATAASATDAGGIEALAAAAKAEGGLNAPRLVQLWRND